MNNETHIKRYIYDNCKNQSGFNDSTACEQRGDCVYTMCVQNFRQTETIQEYRYTIQQYVYITHPEFNPR